MQYELSLHKLDIAPGAAIAPNGRAIDAIYVVSGGLRLKSAAFHGALGANSALHTSAALELAGGSLPTVALHWELSPQGSARVASGSPGVTASTLLTSTLELDPQARYLLRCDRVDFPPAGEALRHTHQGGGTRCLLFGGIEIETKGARHAYRPLEAWFEAGPDPVYAAASRAEPSAFVRVMVLPRSLLGKSSISYVNPEDLAKPKSQRYQVFIDAPIELPR